MLNHTSEAFDIRRLWVLVLALFATSALAEGPTGFAAIELDPAVIDFGTMAQHEVRTRTITISNVGGAVLTISDVETTCGCTAAKPEKTILQPGEQTTMLITFDSKQFQGDQKKFVRIHSNDAAEAITQFPVIAMVKAPLIFTPGNKLLGFGRVRAEEAKPLVVRVYSPDGVPLQIECTQINDVQLQTEILPDTNGDPARKLIKVSLQPDMPPGEIRELITFKTNIPEIATFDLEVSGRIINDVEIYPSKHNFRYVKEGQELSRLFELKMPRGYKMNITKAEVDLPGFEVESITFHEPTGNWQIMVKGKAMKREDGRAQKARGRVKGTLKVMTDHPEMPVFQAELMYLIRL